MDPAYLGRPMPVPTRQRSGRRLSPRMMLLGGGLLLAGIIAIILSAVNGANDPKKDMGILLARVDTLQKIVALGVKNTKNTDLKKVNSDASLIISGDARRIEDAIVAQGVKGPSKSAASQEADTETFTRLEDARVNGRFDTEYPTILSQKLADTNILMQDIFSRTKSNSVKEALSTSYKDFAQIQKDLDEL